MESIIESILINNIKEYKLIILGIKPTDKNIFIIGSVIISTLSNYKFKIKHVLNMLVIWLKWHWVVEHKKKWIIWNKLLDIIKFYKCSPSNDHRYRVLHKIFKNMKTIISANTFLAAIKELSGVKIKVFLLYEKSFFDNQFIEKLRLQNDEDIKPCFMTNAFGIASTDNSYNNNEIFYGFVSESHDQFDNKKKLRESSFNNSLNREKKKNYNFTIDNWKTTHNQEIFSRLKNFVEKIKLNFIKQILKIEIITVSDYDFMSYEEKCNYYIKLSDSFRKITDKIKSYKELINDSINYFDDLIFDKKNDRKKNNMFMNSLLKFDTEEVLHDNYSGNLLDNISDDDDCKEVDNKKIFNIELDTKSPSNEYLQDSSILYDSLYLPFVINQNNTLLNEDIDDFSCDYTSFPNEDDEYMNNSDHESIFLLNKDDDEDDKVISMLIKNVPTSW